jgi:hypothetical protein
MAGTERVTRQIVEVLVKGAVYAPYTYGTERVTRQVVEVLYASPFYDFSTSNTISFGQVAGNVLAAITTAFLKPLILKSNTIQSLPNTDIINHGDFPIWTTNGLEWTQTRQAINARIDANAACSSQAITTFGSSSNASIGGVLASNGKIYGAPSNANSQILKIDPSTSTITSFAGPSLSATLYYKTITISNTNVSSDLTNFPLCVRISGDTDIGAHCLPTGDDIYFKDSNSNVLYCECESFSVTGGAATGVFWVKVGTISSSTTTTITCYYGDVAAVARTPTSVWDSDFKGVYHLGLQSNGVTFSMLDSTINANNGTNSGSITSATGEIGSCGSFNGSSKYGTIPKSISTDFTISFWVNPSANGASGSQWYNGSGLTDGEVGGVVADFGITLLSNKIAFGTGNLSGTDVTIQSAATLTLGTWYKVDCTRVSSSGAMITYINGVSSATGNGATGARSAPPSIAVGRIQTGSNYFNGYIDDIQVSGIARPAAWIKFSYYNQYSNEISWGAQTSFQGPPQLRFAGGVLAPNGSIYCIPDGSLAVLKIDPTTDTATSFGSLAAAGWYGGVLAADGMIYCIPNNNTTVLQIDPTTDTITTFGSLTGISKWNGGVLAQNGVVYGIPCNSTTVLKIGSDVSNYAYYKQITIPHTNVSADLTNFPLCVHINADTDLGTACLQNGNDIRFVATNGSTLPMEKDIFSISGNAATGIFWVNVPLISSSVDTIIYMYYGYANAKPYGNTVATWDSNFVGVWHFGNGTTLLTTDSTINANNGTNAGTVTAATGVIGGGASFPQSSTGIISVPNNSVFNMTTNPWQVDFWMAGSDQTNNYASAIGTYNNATYGTGAFSLRWDDAAASYAHRISMTHHEIGDKVIYNSSDLTFGTWYHVVVNRVGTTLNMYINGALNATKTISSGILFNWTANSYPLYIGGSWDSNGQGGYKGLLDEVRISNINRSDAWIAFEYANQVNSTGQLTTGAQTANTNSLPIGTMTFGNLSSSTAKWCGGVIASNGCIYGIPNSSTSVLKIDPTTDIATTFGTVSGSWYGGVLAPNGMIYCMPYSGTSILKIDPTTDTVTTFGVLTGSTKWAGGVLAMDGCIYGIPYSSATILKIGSSLDDIPTDFCLSRHFNKF